MALISVTISGNAGPLKKSLDESEGRLGKFGSSVKKVGIAAAAAFGAVGGAALVVGKQLIAAGEAAATSNARIEQIAKSMNLFGDATQEVSNRLVKLAEKTALQTGVDQNAIKLTQAKLLTFVDLAKSADTVGGAFDRATQAAIDLAAAGFGEASQNAVQLGKALQDPIKGITALARSGVTFTEAEKARIETLVESNKLGEAQALILEAIEKQVGGTAVATANASDKMKVAFSQLKERLGAVLLPAFEGFSKFLIERFFPAMERIGEKVIPIVQDAFAKISDFIRDRVVPIIQNYLIPYLQFVGDVFVDYIIPTIKTIALPLFEGLRLVFDKVSEAVARNRDSFVNLVGFLKTFYSFVRDDVAPILGVVLGTALKIVANLIGPLIDGFAKFVDVLAAVGKFVIGIAKTILDAFESMVNGVIDAINFVIRAYNKIPLAPDIPTIGNVSFAAPGVAGNVPTTPTLPSGAGANIAPGTITPITLPEVGGGTTPTGTGGGGGGGGGRSGAVTILPVDMTGQIGLFPSTEITGGGGGGFGAAMGTEALLDGMTGGISITVNTVSADANLPNLIVEALQQYNLTSGPIDVAIAV